jgi:hypothetical protein
MTLGQDISQLQIKGAPQVEAALYREMQAFMASSGVKMSHVCCNIFAPEEAF